MSQLLQIIEFFFAIKEIQIDCDWTDSTRNRFFRFTRTLGKLAHAEHSLISATIRLHQIKYFERTGIPPVDRGVLMFYNMGKLAAASERSSIFNTEDAEKYTSRLSQYPLPMDLIV